MDKENKQIPTGDAVAFQPDALEIKYQRLPWPARYGILAGVVLIVIAIVWACIGEVDVIVTGRGKLIAESDIVIKPLESSVIKSIDVKAGDIVHPGEVLITFDPTLNQASADRYASEIEALKPQFDRYMAEFSGSDYTPGAKADENEMWQVAIFRQRKAYYQEKLRYYEESAKRIDSSRKSSEESLAKELEILAALQELETTYVALKAERQVILKDLIELKVQRMQVEAQINTLQNSLTEVDHQLQALLAEKQAFVEEWNNNISEKLISVQRELTTNTKQLEQYRRLLDYSQLKSPCDAVVLEIASFPVGSAVRETEALITLVPLDSVIQAEVKLRPQDIAKVSRGAEARIKLDAYPFQKHGTLDGAVSLISENTFSAQQATPGELPVYYQVRLQMSGELQGTKENFRLIPGMEVTAEIKTGRRKIIEYLLYPLIKGLDESFREP